MGSVETSDNAESLIIKEEPVEIAEDGVGTTVEESLNYDNNYLPEQEEERPGAFNEEPEAVITTIELKDTCPISLQDCTEDEVQDAFRRCYKKGLKLTSAKLKSFLENVCTVLTQTKMSTYEERKHLYYLWIMKYRDSIVSLPKERKRKRAKSVLMNRTKRKKRKLQTTPKETNTGDCGDSDFLSSLMEPNDIIVKLDCPIAKLECPPKLLKFTEEEIIDAFKSCLNLTANLQHRYQFSLFGKAFTHLTGEKDSTRIERKYMHDLWKFKYRLIVDQHHERNMNFKKIPRKARHKYMRRLREEQQLLALQSVEAVYTDNSKSDGRTKKKPKNSTVLKIVIPKEAVTIPKQEIEQDDHNSECDFLSSPSTKCEELDVQDSRLKQKAVVSVVKLDYSKCKPTDGNKRTRRGRTNLNENIIEDSLTFSEPELAENDRFSDDDYVPPEDNYDNLESLETETLVELVENSKINVDGSTKSVCKVCGRPTSNRLISFHVRTHFSFEEQKQYLIERERNEKDKKLQTKGAKESRLEQLKLLLEVRKKKIESKVQVQEVKKSQVEQVQEIPVPPRIQRRHPRVNMKRDGNYGPVQCTHCGKIVTRIYTLRAHEFTAHGITGSKTFACSVCGRPFGHKQYIEKHLSTHFSLEEHKKFATWIGTIQEFIERLNTGGDLSKPPTQKKFWKKWNPTIRQYRIPKPCGRPRKYPKKVDKNKRETNSQTSIYQLATSQLSNEELNASSSNNSIVHNNEVADSQAPDPDTIVPPFLNSVQVQNAFSWNQYSYKNSTI